MYIKQIVVDGFKSYGQRTEIKGFDHQFNAITGLNGTGKSNILDSICFVLGISNLTQVRASSLQDLIYKSGQAGVNKATVSITFDNRNQAQCPPGFENLDEITITRQVVMGGKNKYLINGSNVQSKKIQDLFCSIQLNVNNPHFLIMQGRITKVLNMKPPEILSMIEEAAGTRMYETKRREAQKTIEKKDAKLIEIETIFREEVSPKLEKLREERSAFMEFQRLEREIEHMLGLYQAYQYYATQRNTTKAEERYKRAEAKVQAIEDQIQDNQKEAEAITEEVANLSQQTEKEKSGKVEVIEAALKAKEKEEAQANSLEKAKKQAIATEEKKKTQLENNAKDDAAALKSKEQELDNVKNIFQKLKDADSADTEAFAASQRKYEAVSAGMEVNEEGEAATLQEQLMSAKQEAAQANTEGKQANMQLVFNEKQLAEKQKGLGANAADYEKDKASLNNMQKEVEAITNSLNKLNFSEERMNELQNRRRQLTQENRQMRERVENFEAHKPHTNFHYKDPEPNFNKNHVKGVVCRLIKLKDKIYSTAIETAAGGRLYNVIVDTEVTSKKLLQRGQLQQRTTFIPLNKIQGGQINNKIVSLAQNLVGAENVQPALALLDYDESLQPAMEYIFGNVFICKDMNTARQITFNDRIKKKCVTLDGDVTDPGGTLSGGAKQKGGSILLQLDEIQQFEQQLRTADNELSKIEAEVRSMSVSQENYANYRQRLELRQHEMDMLKRRLQQTVHAQQQEEVDNLKATIAELKENIKVSKEIETKNSKKAKDLEMKMKDAKGHRERQLKEAEAEMKKLKQKADGSRKEWKQREQDYETLNLEISELKKGLENTEAQLKICIETIEKLKEEYTENLAVLAQKKEEVSALQKEVKAEKAAIAQKNKEIQKKLQKKEQLLAQVSEFELEIQKQSHEVKKCKDEYTACKSREADAARKVKQDNRYLSEAEAMDDKAAGDLEKRIRTSQDKKSKLSRTVNTKAQSMYEHEEKQYIMLTKKKNIVEKDKRSLLLVMADLDKKKKEAIELAFAQVSKDFGSIFGTLLPGSNAKLIPQEGKSILDGLEVKVLLGGVWKESLTELSGGQRSLVALSLILAMLLFKPAPLYILDEVDAALDLSHTQNIGNMLKSHFKQSQFIIVSLKDGMFNNANVLFRTSFIDGMSAVQRTVNKAAH